MQNNSKSSHGEIKGLGLHIVAGKGKRTNARACHTVPSTVGKPMRAAIASTVSAGRSIAQTAKEFNADRCVVTELWLRDELAKLRAEVAWLREMHRRAA